MKRVILNTIKSNKNRSLLRIKSTAHLNWRPLKSHRSLHRRAATEKLKTKNSQLIFILDMESEVKRLCLFGQLAQRGLSETAADVNPIFYRRQLN